MNVHILLDFKDGPWGGANQFLKGLKRYFVLCGTYSEDAAKADIILFNSHHHLEEVITLKKRYDNLIFIHRIDGPIRLSRNKDRALDHIVYLYNDSIADGTIFQTNWSRQQNYQLGLKQNPFEIVIINAPDPSLFNRNGKKPFSENRKIRLIATSWSSNWRKGFETYQWLDEHLDFARYEMTFIGNTPIPFKNIRHIPPLQSRELAQHLKKHDIFIFASHIESCSNALLEAMHCGLPAIAFNDCSNPEIVGRAGALFNRPEDIPALLEQLVQKYVTSQTQIALPPIEEVGRAYYEFMNSVYAAVQKGEYKTKNLSPTGYLKLLSTRWAWKLTNRIKRKRKYTWKMKFEKFL